MAKYGLIAVAFFFLAVTMDKVSVQALKCWRCSSDASDGAFCDDPFDPSITGEQNRHWSYTNCSSSNFMGGGSFNSRFVCKKLVKDVYGKRIVSRSCLEEDVNTPHDKCQNDPTAGYERIIFCSTCSADGCNGASGLVPIGGLIFLPALIGKYFFL